MNCNDSSDNNLCNEEIIVRNFNYGYTITEDDAIMSDWNQDTINWNGTTNNNSIDLTIGGMCGDECSWSYRITLVGVDKQLPCCEKIEYNITELLLFKEKKYYLSNGTVSIQDWGESTYSGFVEGVMSNSDSISFVFWWEKN